MGQAKIIKYYCVCSRGKHFRFPLKEIFVPVNLQVLMECILCTPFSPSVTVPSIALWDQHHWTSSPGNSRLLSMQHSLCKHFIREFFSCLLQVKKPETPPVLSDSRKYSDWIVTAVLITWSLSNMERVEDQAGSSTCSPAQARSDRSHLCASGTALPRPCAAAGNTLLLNSSVATTPAD